MKIGVIGGSGLYDMEALEPLSWIEVSTPFGDPSDAFLHGILDEREVYFLPRHGRGHRILPSEINHRANLYAFKSLGVEQILSITAVGSLKADLHPRDLCVFDQYFDRTKSGPLTFFGKGLVAHIAFGQPVCPSLRKTLLNVARAEAAKVPEPPGVHDGGTYVNIEGPAFSTRAESMHYHRSGFDLVGMTSLPEARLSREAEICYAAMALVTDYDSWEETTEAVTVDMVMENMQANVGLARAIIREAVAKLPEERGCLCRDALQNAFMSDPDLVPDDLKKRLGPLVSKYFN